MKINKLYLPIVFTAAIALGLVLGSKLGGPSFVTKTDGKSKLNKLIDFIDREYVDDVNTDSIVDITVDRILENLDPHSVYINQEDLVAVNENMRGDFVGIGVNFYMYKDSVAVIKPLKDGPSEIAGIKAGDRILYADKYQLYDKNLPNDSLYPHLKGEIGSEVNLTVFRKTEGKKLKIKVKRDVVPIKSVDVAFMVSDDLGYIKINRFAETTYEEFHKALLRLKSKDMQRLIIDLRDNGGGYLEVANAIADDLLKEGELIVKTKNKRGREDVSKATSDGDFEEGKVYVLINENSASASEILAGAVQDNDRGTIVGRRSFGKGLVQREMPLGDGSAIRLTVARYYTPSGRSIQKPYEDKGEAYFNEFEKRFESGELYEADSIHVADSLKYRTKKGRIVYGGGGITPDIFVPYEAKHGEEGTYMIMQSGIVSYFVFEQLDQKRNFFNGLSLSELKKEVCDKDNYLTAFQKHIADGGIILNFSDKAKIKKYLYAEFVRQLFDDEHYYEVVLSEDKMVKKVLELN
jgi:carboxyl-terminal processing protease